MHKKFFIVTAIVLAVAAGVSASVYAQGPQRGWGHRHGGMLEKMTRELNLTEAQQTQIKNIMADEQSRTRPLREKLRQNRQAQSLKVDGNFDDTQVRAFANNQAQIMRDLIIEKERTKSQIYSVLTPDQRQKALQLIQQHEQRRQERQQQASAKQQTQSK
ncbi:MAG TPA: Spy/CpxP family protein refolding chaperone [Candidatus Angelobacter sp.]|nr:Spy/CpxP family protein refolding chaperone [Candidatus Angelobacter sp.]